MTRFAVVLLIGVFLTAAVQAQSRVVIELPAKAAPPERALKYTLLPEAEELTPGNAASRWRQAVQALKESGVKFTDKEEAWLTRTGTPLKELPRKEVRALLDKAKAALRLADQAARRRECDWEYPPLTLQTAYEIPFTELQSLRDFVQIISLRFRLQLAEKKFDEAAATLQTGLSLGRHVGEGPTITQSLVGVAITSVMLGHVEELMQQPGAPNLYWALTALPRPFLDIRKPLEHERRTLRRSLPQLDESPPTPDKAQKLIDDVFTVWVKESLYYMFTQNEEEAVVQEKIGKALTVAALVPEAKKYLVSQGRKADEVEALSAAQAVLTWFADQKTRESDELFKWVMLPPWQALQGLEEREKKRTEARETAAAGRDLSGGLALAMLSSRVLVCWSAGLRIERWIAGLRTVEAVRLHAAKEGQVPKALQDVSVVPLPLDPWTGTSFEEFCSLSADKAVVEVPQRPAWDRRYELAPMK
jgi:hypothetical protein